METNTKFQNLKTLEVTIRHADNLKKVNMEVDLTASQPESENEEIDTQAESNSEDNDVIDDTDETHDYRKKLRSRTQRYRQENSSEVNLIYNITEFFLQRKFDDNVNIFLQNLGVDVNSFYR